MLSSSGGHPDASDGKGFFLLTENLVKHHSFILQPDVVPVPGLSMYRFFSSQHSLRNGGIGLQPNAKLTPTATNAGPLLPLIGVPFDIIADAIHYSTVKFTSYFVNSLILALMSTVVFAFASEFYRSRKIGFVLSLVAGVGSFVWPYISSYLEQPLSALVLVTCLYFLFIASSNTQTTQHEKVNYAHNRRIIKYSPILAGLFLGLQSLTHPGTIMVVPGIAIIAAYVLRKEKGKVLQFFLPFFCLFALQLYFNEMRFGSITEFGYGFQVGGGHAAATYAHIYTEGLYGLLVSPGFGLMVYFPLIILFPLAVYYLWKYNKVFCIAFLYVFFSIWVFYGTLKDVLWIGLGCWGPRYMIPVIPVLAIASGSVLKAVFPTMTDNGIVESTESSSLSSKISPAYFKDILKVLFTMLALSGFIVNLLGVLVWYQLGFGYGWGVLHVAGDHPMDFAWNPKYVPVLLHWKVLTTDWWKSVSPVYGGWNTCIPDNFIYCNFGILPSLAIVFASLSAGCAITEVLFNRRLQTPNL